MKRLFYISLTLMLALSIQAQDAVTFMNLPVKGTASIMRKELTKKGFILNEDFSLTGCVDGDTCMVVIGTDKGKITDVSVIDREGTEDIDKAIERYNSLIDFYKDNSVYTEYEANIYINDADKQTHRVNINNEWYYAEFFQVCEPQRYNKRLSFKLTAKYGDYRIVRCYDNSDDITLPAEQ